MKHCPFCAEEILDAAIVCKHCGRDLKGGATPVQIVAPPPKKTGAVAWLALGFFVLVGAAWCSALLSPTPSRSGTPAAAATDSTVDLAARVNFTGTQFTVTNISKDQTWENVKCTLNPAGFLRDGYDLQVGTVIPGQQVSVGAMQFAKSDGTRFNPFQTKPTQMRVTATVNGKPGFYLGGWK